MEDDIEQPSLADIGNRRQTGNGLRVKPAVGVDETQAPWPLGDQLPAIGKKGDAPRVFERFSDDAELVFVWAELWTGPQL
jgi:hypothetical protein